MTRKGPWDGDWRRWLLHLLLVLTFPFGLLQHRLLTRIQSNKWVEIRAADWSGGSAAIEWRDLVPLDRRPGRFLLGAAVWQLESFRQFRPVMVEYAILLPGVAQSEGGRATGSLTGASWSYGSYGRQRPPPADGSVRQFETYVSRGTIKGRFVQSWIPHKLLKGWKEQ